MDKLPRPRGNTPPLPPFLRFVPFIFLLTLLLTFGLGGCGGLLISPDQAREAAADKIGAAVQAEESGDRRRADAAAADAVKIMGGDSDAVCWVARELTRAGRPHTALHLLNDATRTPAFNDDPNLYLRLALAQEQVGNQDGVSQALDEAVRRAGSLRQSAIGKKETRAAELLKVGGFWADVENPRASTAQSLDALRAAYALLPEDPLVQNELGYILADRGTTKAQKDEAFTLTRRAAEQIPDNGIILDSLGWALYKTGDLAGARRVLRKAVDREGGIPELRCHLGIVFAESKQYHDAAIELNRAVQLWPHYEEAQRALKALPPGVVTPPTPAPISSPLNAPISAPSVSSQQSVPPSSSPAPASAAGTEGNRVR